MRPSAEPVAWCGSWCEMKSPDGESGFPWGRRRGCSRCWGPDEAHSIRLVIGRLGVRVPSPAPRLICANASRRRPSPSALFTFGNPGHCGCQDFAPSGPTSRSGACPIASLVTSSRLSGIGRPRSRHAGRSAQRSATASSIDQVQPRRSRSTALETGDRCAVGRRGTGAVCSGRHTGTWHDLGCERSAR